MLEYIAAILDPQIAVEDGKSIKQPSLIPIPSATTAFRVNVNISTDDSGDFFLAWNPNYLINKENLEYYSGIFSSSTLYPYNTYSNLVYKDSANKSLNFCPSYVADVSLSKYRLVSSKIKVTYIGSNLEKSGMMYACASFDPTPIRYGYLQSGDQIFPMKTDGKYIDLTSATNYPVESSTYNLLTEANISNGIWNTNVNIVQTNQGISCLHVPIDPTNEIFYPMGSYFGYKNTDTTAKSTTVVESQFGNTKVINRQDISGSQLCFLICGHGLPKNKEVINIQIFYNFEIIATPASAPYIKMSNFPFNSEDTKKMNDIIKTSYNDISIKQENGNISKNLNKWKDIAYKILRQGKTIYDIYKTIK